MPRRKILKTKGVVIDTEEVKSSLREIAENTRKEVAELARQSLQAQIDTINRASSKRYSAAIVGSKKTEIASKGTVDRPLKNARVIVDSRRNAADTRDQRIIVFVSHVGPKGVNLFSLLDVGVKKTRTVPEGETIIFPAYVGNLIPDDPDIADPEQVSDIITKLNVEIKRDYKGAAEMVVLRSGRSIRGFEGKNFYAKTAAWVEKQLIGRKIVNANKTTSVKLKKNDVKITVPKKRYFKA